MTTDVELRLSAAGLNVLGTVPDVCGITPFDAWKPVIRLGVAPTVTIPDDNRSEADRHKDTNLEWRRLAARENLISDGGTFLISVAAVGAAAMPWYRVRIAGDLRLSQFLGVDMGEPEFVTAAEDGHAVVGVTTEEHGTWLISVNGHA
jgi:hypothetical protein